MSRKRKIREWIEKPKRCTWKVRLWQGRNIRSGETLVEVMVSIVIFLLLVALLQGSVAFCTNAQRKSREIRKNTAEAIEKYWTAKDAGTVTSETSGADNSLELKFKTKNGTGSAFSVNVTLDKYSVSTGGDSGTGETVTFYSFGNGAN